MITSYDLYTIQGTFQFEMFETKNGHDIKIYEGKVLRSAHPHPSSPSAHHPRHS